MQMRSDHHTSFSVTFEVHRALPSLNLMAYRKCRCVVGCILYTEIPCIRIHLGDFPGLLPWPVPYHLPCPSPDGSSRRSG